MEKTYLMPKLLRQGSPLIQFVTATPQYGYELHIAYGLIELKEYSGIESEYNNFSGTKISKEFFEAFQKESELNHLKYKKTLSLFP